MMTRFHVLQVMLVVVGIMEAEYQPLPN